MTRRSDILEHVIGQTKGELSVELARYILTLEFPESDQARYAELAQQAQLRLLSEEERAELEEFLDVNDFLTIVQSKARAALGGQSSAA